MSAHLSVLRRARCVLVKLAAAATALISPAPALTRLAPLRIDVASVTPRSSRKAMRR